MSKPMLFDYELQEGDRYLSALCKEVYVHSALWLYTEERDDWHLVIALHIYDELGALETYRVLLKVFNSLILPLRISSDSIEAISPNHEVIKELSKAQEIYKSMYKGTHIKNALYGEYIDEAYIYFVNRDKA